MTIELAMGDITTETHADAIVNAANTTLLGGGGVDGAIHRAAGAGLLAECRTLDGCRTGDAKITGAYNLKVDYVIHTVGPVYRDGLHGESELLASCYRRCIEVGAAHECHTIAFPAISAGVYRYPLAQAAEIAINTVADAMAKFPSVHTARFWLFNQSVFDAFTHALDRRLP